MTTYLLDTNACIALINSHEANVRRRFQRAVARKSVILLSSIVAFELWYGVAKSQRKESNTVRLDAFLAGQARRHGATLVTSNANEFARVAGLKWEDWAVSRR